MNRPDLSAIVAYHINSDNILERLEKAVSAFEAAEVRVENLLTDGRVRLTISVPGFLEESFIYDKLVRCIDDCEPVEFIFRQLEIFPIIRPAYYEANDLISYISEVLDRKFQEALHTIPVEEIVRIERQHKMDDFKISLTSAVMGLYDIGASKEELHEYVDELFVQFIHRQ